jgi:hypothetical protein
MKPQKKVTNELASEYSISVAVLFSAVTKMSKSMGMLWNAVTNTRTPVNALCMYMYTI